MHRRTLNVLRGMLTTVGHASALIFALAGRPSPLPPYGPYHRTGSAQSDETTRRQLASGEIWGKTDRFSFFPSVDAWRGSLPLDKPGVESYTDVAPEPGGPPHHLRWFRVRPGVRVEGDYAKIRATITVPRYR